MKKSFLIIILLVFPIYISAGIVGFISYIDGTAYRQKSQKLTQDSILTVNNVDQLSTQEDSNLRVAFRDGSQLLLFENSTILLNFNSEKKANQIELTKGICWLLIENSANPYLLKFDKVLIKSKASTLLLGHNPEETSGFVKIDSGDVNVKDSKSFTSFTGGTLVVFQAGSVAHQSTDMESIKLETSLDRYYLTASGKIPVTIRASVPAKIVEKSSFKAFVISATPNLIVESPLIDFYQDEIEFRATAIGTGRSKLYVVSIPQTPALGITGSLSVPVFPMRETKTMKIKTARGTINIKLAPTEIQ